MTGGIGRSAAAETVVAAGWLGWRDPAAARLDMAVAIVALRLVPGRGMLGLVDRN